jgi:hypothetical protein
MNTKELAYAVSVDNGWDLESFDDGFLADYPLVPECVGIYGDAGEAMQAAQRLAHELPEEEIISVHVIAGDGEG